MYKKLLNQFEGKLACVDGKMLDGKVNAWLEKFAEWLDENAPQPQRKKYLMCIEHGRQEIVVEKSGGEIVVLECGCAYRTNLDGCVRVSGTGINYQRVLEKLCAGVYNVEWQDAHTVYLIPKDGIQPAQETEAEFRLNTLQEFYDLVKSRSEECKKGEWIPLLPPSVQNALAICKEKLSRLELPK